MTGADIDLLSPAGRPPFKGGRGDSNDPQTATYTFTAKTTDYASRFRLVFAADADGTSANPVFAYISNGEIVVYGEGTLQIVDVTGRIIRTVGLSQCGSRTTTNGMPAGVYILRLINGENVRTQKIVVE